MAWALLGLAGLSRIARMPGPHPLSHPSDAAVVQTLRDGYWDLTEVIRLGDGSLRVRKASKVDPASGPWGMASLRREIHYLQSLPTRAADLFPRLLAAWDADGELGYEMSYVQGADAGALAQAGALDQVQADAFQDALGQAVFDVLHEPAAGDGSLAEHVGLTLRDALDQLAGYDEFAEFIHAPSVRINGECMAGCRAALEALQDRPAALDRPPRVRLHGDFFLANILLPYPDGPDDWPRRLTLVDPVSVAGVFEGHPIFDLVKYESYAGGELLAMRAEKVDATGFDRPSADGYKYRVWWDHPLVAPFRRVDWRGRLREAYLRRYGPPDRGAYALLEAYFAAAMALCTRGVHRKARVLNIALALRAAGEAQGRAGA